MRAIHPELVGRNVDTLSPLVKWWNIVLKTVTPEVIGGRTDKLWETQVKEYLKGVIDLLMRSSYTVPKKFLKDEIVNLTTNSLVPPLRTIMEMCPHKNSYHMLTHMPEYSTLCTMTAELLLINSKQNRITDLNDPALQAVTTHNIALYSYLSWFASGCKTYTMTSNLSYGLRHTTLNNYQADWLRAPLPACYIEFPKNEFTFTTYADKLTPSDTGFITLPIEGAYILEDTTPLNARLWRVVVICQYKDTPSDQVHINHYYIPLKQGASIEACLREAISMMKGEQAYSFELPGNEIGKVGVVQHNGMKWDDRIVKSAEEVFKFIMNCVIYITREDADIIFKDTSSEYAHMRARMLAAKGKKREILKDRLKKMHNNVRVVVGSSYTIKRGVEKHASGSGESGRHIHVRTLVSGHWRNQPCGTRNTDRKTIWIEPHWRGPEEAPLTASSRAVVS